MWAQDKSLPPSQSVDEKDLIPLDYPFDSILGRWTGSPVNTIVTDVYDPEEEIEVEKTVWNYLYLHNYRHRDLFSTILLYLSYIKIPSFSLYLLFSH